ncbi:MAG TPA: hypothetical protein VM450_07245 [Thermomicrobiales bacterium]|nr:hypothetical protein [Thermomicrobiales bacterium]
MKRLRRTLAGLALGAAIAASGTPALTLGSSLQAATEPAVRAELAAATLAASDLPTGFSFVGETFLTAEQVAGETLDPNALTDAGFATQYVSVYENPQAKLRVRSYVSSWTDAAAAEAGFAILEDEAMTTPGAELSDGGADVGEEPRETTSGTYPAPDGSTIRTVDVTFRRDNLLAGVALEKLDGSEVDAKTAGDLAKRMDARVQAVQKGDSPANTDLALPAKVLSLQPLGQEIQVGFLGPVEVERIYGLQGSVLDSVQASWVESVEQQNDAAPGVRVTIGVTTFGKEADAKAVVEHSAELVAPLSNQKAINEVKLDGADAVRAYHFTSPGKEGTDIDSYRIIFAVGKTVTVIDVQGTPTAAAAAEAATALATAQLGCEGGDSCELPELPDVFAG